MNIVPSLGELKNSKPSSGLNRLRRAYKKVLLVCNDVITSKPSEVAEAKVENVSK